MKLRPWEKNNDSTFGNFTAWFRNDLAGNPIARIGRYQSSKPWYIFHKSDLIAINPNLRVAKRIIDDELIVMGYSFIPPKMLAML